MDAVEFAEWQAFYRICPFGDDWAQTDLIAWMLYQVNRGRNSQSLGIGSFLPKGFGLGVTEDQRPAKNTDEVGKTLLEFFKQMGAGNGK